jgi:hypothetical protein
LPFYSQLSQVEKEEWKKGSHGNADLVGEIWHDFILVNICPYACYISLSDYQYFGFWA